MQICLLYISRDSKANKELSKISDVRIAWGGRDAVETIINYQKKYNASDIVFGPKLSLSAIGRESLEKESRASRLARAVAIDSSIFDQMACASSHNLFIEKGGKVSVEQFIEFLEERMKELADKIPANNNSFKIYDDIKEIRLNAYMDENILSIKSPRNMKWTIIHDKIAKLNTPIYGRTLFVHEVDDLSQITDLLSDTNQVIGLDLRGVRRDALSKAFLKKGVSRISFIGQMAEFTFPWDDVFPTDKLVRWCYA